MDLLQRAKELGHVDHPAAGLDRLALAGHRRNVLDVDVEQPVGELLGRLARIDAAISGVADVDAQPDAAVEILDLLVCHVGRAIELVDRPVIVDRHADVVLLNLLIDQREQFVDGHADNHLHPGALGILEGPINLRGLVHVDDPAAVKVEAGRFRLRRGLGQFLGRTAHRQVGVLQADVSQSHPLGHGQRLVERELAARIGSQPQLQGLAGVRLDGRPIGSGAPGKTAVSCQRGCGPDAGPLQEVSSGWHDLLLIVGTPRGRLGTDPFFGEKLSFARKTSAENMDLSPSATQRGQSHFRGGQAYSRRNVLLAAKIGTVPGKRSHFQRVLS